jgi:hypothetical protein
MLGIRTAQLGNFLFDAAARRIRILRREPVRQQFRHRRDVLDIDIVSRHVVDAAFLPPAPGIDQPKYLPPTITAALPLPRSSIDGRNGLRAGSDRMRFGTKWDGYQ